MRKKKINKLSLISFPVKNFLNFLLSENLKYYESANSRTIANSTGNRGTSYSDFFFHQLQLFPSDCRYFLLLIHFNVFPTVMVSIKPRLIFSAVVMKILDRFPAMALILYHVYKSDCDFSGFAEFCFLFPCDLVNNIPDLTKGLIKRIRT